ncbi:MAG: helix-turn-helix transcriptional regulator [Asticcacaulis sp.]
MLNPGDEYVGNMVQIRREQLRITVVELASKLGLTHQQMMEAEYGRRRLGASKLYELSLIMKVPVAYFICGFKA